MLPVNIRLQEWGYDSASTHFPGLSGQTFLSYTFNPVLSKAVPIKC
jgi:hypothetical protein